MTWTVRRSMHDYNAKTDVSSHETARSAFRAFKGAMALWDGVELELRGVVIVATYRPGAEQCIDALIAQIADSE